MIQTFFTARELAEIAAERGFTSFPQGERGVQIYAERAGWNALPSNLCRKRKGQAGGGGREYHQSLLPEAMFAAVNGRGIKAAFQAELALREDRDNRKLVSMKTASLRAHQRAVMEARAQVLLAIDAYQIANGQSRASAVKDFLLAQTSHPEWLTAPDMFDLTSAVLEMANDRRKGVTSIGRSSIYAWMKARDEQGVIGLAPALTKVAEPVPPGFVDFLKFYARPSKLRVTEALADYLASSPLFPLTLDQVYHTLKVKLSDIEKNVGREGLLTLRSRMAYVQRTTEGLWPTTIYTADGKTFDAEIADPVSGKAIRPEITSVLDVATRKCVGIAISRKENMIAVVEALRRSCVSHGICAIFYTDRGVGYKNKTIDGDVGGLMGRLSITKMHALPYNSQAKGIIERFNGTCWNPMARRLDTYIGEEMDKEAGHAIHKLTRSEIATFGQSSNLPTWDHFLAMCEEAVADYNDREHSGLPKISDPATGKMRHMTPNECWASHVASGFEPVTIDKDDEDDLFRPYEVRKVRRALVEWNTNTYFHLALEAWHGRNVMVGYDLHQADKVWVREFDEDTGQPGPLICVAEFGGNKERYISLTYQRKAEEKRVQGRLKLIDKKRQDINEELDDYRLIDLGAVIPMPVITPEPAPVDFARPLSVTKPQTVRHMQHPDVELAFDVLADPKKLTSGRRQLLLDLTAGRAGRELLRISGVDLAMLDDLLRSAA